MKNRQRLFTSMILFGVVLISLIIISGNFRQNSKVKIECFVYDPCGGCFSENIPCKPCTVVLEMEQYLYNKVDELGLRDASVINVYNTMDDTKRNLLNERMQKDFELEYPVLFINDKTLFGWSQINRSIDEMLLKVAKARHIDEADDSTHVSFSYEQTRRPMAVYFKMEDCRGCNKTEQYLTQHDNFNGLCEIITYSLDNADGIRLFEEYCKKYGVNSETAGAPMIFIGNVALEGFEEIDTFLEAYIKNGYGETTTIIKEKKDE